MASSYWKKAFFISLAVALIILGLRYALFYGFDIRLEQMFTGVEQATFPSQCIVTENGISSNSFICPSDASSCIATITLSCSTQVSGQQVVFRGSSQTGVPMTIAVDSNYDGSLEAWSRGTSYGSCSGTPSRAYEVLTYLPEPYQSNYAYVYNGKVAVCDVQDGKGLYYGLGGQISTSINPIEGESCDFSQGFIRCLGSINAYQCSQDVTGSVSKTITYSGANPGSKIEQITLTPNQKINWIGAIDYEIKRTEQSECTKNMPVSGTNDKYYECVADNNGCGVLSTIQKSCSPNLFDATTGTCQIPTTCKASNGQILNKGQTVCINKYTLEKCSTGSPPSISTQEVTQEGYICEGGVIKPAYTLDIKINGLSSSSVVAETGAKIKIDVIMFGTANNKRIPVTASIDGTAISQTRYTGDTSLTAGKVSLELDSPGEGYHNIKIFIDHPDADYLKIYELRVTSGLNLNLYTDNPTQYDNEYVELRLDAYKAGENKRLTDYQYEAYFNNNRIYADVVEPSGKNLIFLFRVKGDGILRMRAKGTDETGITTDWTSFKEINVKETTISINTNFQSGICPGTVQNTFTTTDNVGNLIDTQNSILIESPLGGKTTLISPTKISTGEYKFTYTFTDAGLYTIKLTSTSNYGVFELGDGLGEPVTILANCGGSPGGGGGVEPGTNWLMYIIFAVIIGIIILVIILMRKKR